MITVNKCGYGSRHTSAFNNLNPRGNEDYLLLLIKTEGFFEKDGIYMQLSPNTGILYGKHSHIHYGSRNTDYSDDWIRFDLSGDDILLLSELSLPLETPFSLPFFGTLSDYIRLAAVETMSGSPLRYQILDGLMRALHFSLASQIRAVPYEHNGSKYYQAMNDMRMEVRSAPYKKWKVAELAERMHLSISHFQYLYRNFFGISCIQDVIEARIAYAQHYLVTTEMTVQALAAFCGYENELHFMRQFKKQTGLTPSEYREENRRRRQSPVEDSI